jgi:hypothetical protein
MHDVRQSQLSPTASSLSDRKLWPSICGGEAEHEKAAPMLFEQMFVLLVQYKSQPCMKAPISPHSYTNPPLGSCKLDHWYLRYLPDS